MKYLVTGGAGFVGSHIVDYLLETKGADELPNLVTILDNLYSGEISNFCCHYRTSRFKFIQESVLEKNLVSDVVGDSDCVIHLAAVVGVKQVLKDPRYAMTVIYLGGKNIIDACLRWRKRVFIASSSEVYGMTHGRDSLTEGDVGIFSDTARWCYGLAKRMVEQYAMWAVDSYGLDVVVGRYFNIAGPRQKGHVVPTFIEKAKKNETIEIDGDGDVERCFSWVWDVAAATIELMQKKDLPRRIFNIGNPANRIKIKDLARKIVEQLGSKSEVKTGPYSDWGIPKRVPDVSALERMGIRLNTPIGEIIKWTCAEGWAESGPKT